MNSERDIERFWLIFSVISVTSALVWLFSIAAQGNFFVILGPAIVAFLVIGRLSSVAAGAIHKFEKWAAREGEKRAEEGGSGSGSGSEEETEKRQWKEWKEWKE